MNQSKLSFISGDTVSPSEKFPLLGHGSAFGKCSLVDGAEHELINLPEVSSLSSPSICFSSNLHQRQPEACLLSVCLTSPDSGRLAMGLYSFLCTQPANPPGVLVYAQGARAKETAKGHNPNKEFHRVSLIGIVSFT